jgi:branched-chain amino acid transport system substrate-binding protein
MRVPFLGADGWDARALLKHTEASRWRQVYVCTHFAIDDRRPEVGRFTAAYRSRFDARGDAVAALGYDATNLVLDAIARARSVDGVDIAAELHRTSGFKGVTGTISFDQRRHAQKPAVFLEVQDGKFHYVTSIAP